MLNIYLPVAFGSDQLADSVGHGLRFDKIVARRIGVAVVLDHADVEHRGHSAAIEVREFRTGFYRLRELDGPITTKVEEDHGVTVDELPDGFTIVGDDGERGKQLVADPWSSGPAPLDPLIH